MLSCVLVWNPGQVGALSSQMGSQRERHGAKPGPEAPPWCVMPVPACMGESLSLPLSTHMDGMGILMSPFPCQVDQEP